MIGEQRRLDELRTATLAELRARSFDRKAVADWLYKAGKASKDNAMAKGAAGAAPHVEC